MIQSLHSQIAALPLTGKPMNVSQYTRGGRLYSNTDSQDSIWVADLSKTAAQPDVVPIRRRLTPPPLVQHFFISVDKQNFHQLNVIDFWDGPRDTVSQALLSDTPGLPALALHWEGRPHPKLHYAANEQMLLTHIMRRRAAGETLIEGAFYAFRSGDTSCIPQNLSRWWDALTESR